MAGYYTLQLTGYLLDCYWKVGMVQTSLPKFALFACYFPQMTSGPVSRCPKFKRSAPVKIHLAFPAFSSLWIASAA